MRPTVLLFDIDGTLITTGGAGRRAIERALTEWAARHGWDVARALEFSFGGMTDRAIVREGLVRSGREVDEPLIDAVIGSYLAVLGEEVAASRPEHYRVHEGMLAALSACELRPHTAVGLGTGNVERGARIKLARVDLDRRFEFGGFGCDAENRAELLRVGAARGAARLGRAVSECRVVIIGDTWRDIAAAKAIGAESLAVATGGESIDSLRGHAPTHLFASLAAPGAVDALLQN
jgi:phosphoglycolate phosphatase-like HAD superfamily hydrolase